MAPTVFKKGIAYEARTDNIALHADLAGAGEDNRLTSGTDEEAYLPAAVPT
jgi:hypothetical protein